MAQTKKTELHVKRRTMFQETWRHLIRNRGAVVGMVFLGLLVAAAILSPFLFNYEIDVIGQNMPERLMAPCASHWFGTDEYGRDLFARVIYGARYSR